MCPQLPLNEVNTEMFDVQISVTVFGMLSYCVQVRKLLTSEGDFQSGTSILLTRSTFLDILTPVVLHSMVFH